MIMVNGLEVSKMLIFAENVILILSDKIIRYVAIHEILDQYLYYDAKKIILDEKNLEKVMNHKFLSSIEGLCFNKMKNYIYFL